MHFFLPTGFYSTAVQKLVTAYLELQKSMLLVKRSKLSPPKAYVI